MLGGTNNLLRLQMNIIIACTGGGKYVLWK